MLLSCFYAFFKIFQARLGKNSKNVSFYKGVCMCKGKTNLVIIFVEPFPNAFAFVGLFSLCKVGLFAAFSSQPDFFADNENNLQSLNTRDTHF